MTWTTKGAVLWDMTPCGHVLPNVSEEVPAFILKMEEYTAFCIYYTGSGRNT